MTTGALYEYVSKLEDIIGIMTDAMIECRHYFYNQSDADHDGNGYVPNQEMRFVIMIDEILNKEKLIRAPFRNT